VKNHTKKRMTPLLSPMLTALSGAEPGQSAIMRLPSERCGLIIPEPHLDFLMLAHHFRASICGFFLKPVDACVIAEQATIFAMFIADKPIAIYVNAICYHALCNTIYCIIVGKFSVS
jgi:hypothetical protein